MGSPPPPVHAMRSMASTVFSEYYTLSVDSRKVCNLASIAAFSSIGVLLRWGNGSFFSDFLQTTMPKNLRDPSGVLFHDLVINVLGCWLMGLLTAFHNELQAISPALYVGLTSGLCGCSTTFSAWMSAMVVLAWDFDDGCSLYPVSAFLGTVVGFSLSYGAHAVGQHTALCCRSLCKRSCEWQQGKAELLGSRGEQGHGGGHDVCEAHFAAEADALAAVGEFGGSSLHVDDSEAMAPGADESYQPVTLGAPALTQRRSTVKYLYEQDITSTAREFMSLLFALGVWLTLSAAYVVCYANAITASARELLLACIIAPLGAWLRYLLGFNNKNTPSFPVYTYLANMIGSVISILIYALLSKALPAGDLGKLGGRPAMLQEWLLAISLGFCGTFTTVSSFVHEVHVLWRERTLVDAYTYTLTTLVSIHAICLGFLLPFAVHYSTCERSPGLSNYDDETAMMSMD